MAETGGAHCGVAWELSRMGRRAAGAPKGASRQWGQAGRGRPGPYGPFVHIGSIVHMDRLSTWFGLHSRMFVYESLAD
jgi:hypothetical protein